MFGIPGTHNIEIYRGLRASGIRHVLTRHEQGASYAADGYARASGRPGVVIATSGPGVTNCITGIANAYADGVPLLVLSPGAPRGQERRNLGFLHEAKDQRAGVDRFAAESVRAESQEALEEAIHRAFLGFRTGRPRPVHIEIPTDLIEEPSAGPPGAAWTAPPLSPDPAAIAGVVAAMREAKRPLIVVGGGAVAHGAVLTALVDATGIPIVTTVQGKGAVSERHPLSAGALAGGSAAFPPIGRADLILAFGTELKNAGTRPGARVARFDIDPGQLHKHRRADLPVLGDAGLAADALLGAVRRAPHPGDGDAWVREVLGDAADVRAEAVERWGALHAAVMRAAREEGAGEEKPAVLTGDSSQISWQGTVRAAMLDEPRGFLTTDGYATLGYGLPAAIGARIARPEANVVALLGDGALMFSVQELITAAEQRLPIPVVVFDNGGYAEIEQNMRDAGVDPFAVALTPPDYAALAAGLRCGFGEARTPEELERAVAAALEAEGPTLIRIGDEVFEAPVWRAPYAAPAA
ncbi:thiamine pyrophosphate-binding protein [Leucobacter sp. gxy201]